jgi:protein-disulfide isomerase
LSRIHFIAGLLALGMAVGCKAQSTPKAALDLTQNRRIEIMVRSQYNVPQDAQVTFGGRLPSQIPGYDTLPVTLARHGQTQVIDFLISADGKTLGRFEKFDLVNDPALSIDVTGRPVRGNPLAKVTVINFDDLECGYCARLHQELFPATLDRYKDKVRFIYKDLPLIEIHPWAMHAAEDANCLAAQSGDVYWNYVDYLHSHGQEVSGDNRDPAKSFAALDRIGRQEATIGKLDAAKLDACLAKQDEAPVRASTKEALSLGVESTPEVFINGERFDGALPQDQVWAVIDRALRDAGVEPPVTPGKLAPPQPAGSGN